MVTATHKAKLSGDHYGYKKGTWVKCILAENLDYPAALWISKTGSTSLLLKVDDYTKLITV